MVDFERKLEEKATKTGADVLVDHWHIIKKAIPYKLTAISQIFPHYSFHDETHSKAILANINKILGETRIELLSATDLWLILCSAYCHDIGMYVVGQEEWELFEASDFLSYIERQQQDKSSSLFPYANQFMIDKSKKQVICKEIKLSAESFRAADYLVSDYIRTKHSVRSKIEIQQNGVINIIPEKISKRLIGILSLICQSHGEDFKWILCDLSQFEDGVAIEKCHPRLIACLLRLGDLLDIDSNRFSLDLVKTLPSIPEDSYNHLEKHLSMEHISINESEISATAVCASLEVADLALKWFKQIKDERINYIDNWSLITPCEGFGTLPLTMDLQVKTKGFDTIDGNAVPRFTVDPNRMLTLIKGSNIYREPIQAIRELLQNSVDAIIQRCWVERRSGIEGLSPKEFVQQIGNGELRIDISSVAEPDQNDTDKMVYHCFIKDNGIGMDKSDIEALISPGSKNKNRTRLIEKMPDWLRPSGSFGIGFQSIFLLTDNVTIETQRFGKEEKYKITITNPELPNGGGIAWISTGKIEEPSWGTTISFDVYRPKIENSWIIHGDQANTGWVIHSFDFVKNNYLDYFNGKLRDEVETFGENCPYPVFLNGERISSYRSEATDNASEPFFYENDGMELSFFDNNYFPRYYYRYQEISDESSKIHPKFVSWKVNLLSKEASDYLSLNRNSFKDNDTRAIVNSKIIKHLHEYVFENWTNLLKEGKTQFLKYMVCNASDSIPIEVIRYLGEIDIHVEDGRPIPYKSLFKYDNITIIPTDVGIRRDTIKATKEGKSLKLLVDSITSEFDFLSVWLFDNQYASAFGSSPFISVSLKSAESSSYEVSKTKASRLIHDWKRFIGGLGSTYSRVTLPCEEAFSDLAIDFKKTNGNSYIRISSFRCFSSHIDYMIAPFIINSSDYIKKEKKWQMDDDLYEMAYKLRKNEGVTKERIKDAYDAFFKFLLKEGVDSSVIKEDK